MIQIIDNLTTTLNNQVLHKLMLEQPWYYLHDTAYSGARESQEIQKHNDSWHFLIYKEGETYNNGLKNLVESLLISAIDKSGLSCSKLVRIRAGMMTRTPFPVIHDPHVDWEDEHMSALYYVHNSDGETVFYNQMHKSESPKKSWEYSSIKDFTIKEKIKPQADRMVIFDGLNYHSSTTPVDHDYRIVINFNWKL
jgi:hypothetical protein